jgi:hypothetical protein
MQLKLSAIEDIQFVCQIKKLGQFLGDAQAGGLGGEDLDIAQIGSPADNNDNRNHRRGIHDIDQRPHPFFEPAKDRTGPKQWQSEKTGYSE